MVRVLAALRRLPLTTTLVAVIVVLSVLSRTLWEPLASQGLVRTVAYGLPAFGDGAWWTVATGAFFAMQPVQYVPPGALEGNAVLRGRHRGRHRGTARRAAHELAAQASARTL